MLSTDLPDPEKLNARFDQAEAAMATQAQLIGAYWKSLRDNEVPPELAEKMVWVWYVKWFVEKL